MDNLSNPLLQETIDQLKRTIKLAETLQQQRDEAREAVQFAAKELRSLEAEATSIIGQYQDALNKALNRLFVIGLN